MLFGRVGVSGYRSGTFGGVGARAREDIPSKITLFTHLENRNINHYNDLPLITHPVGEVRLWSGDGWLLAGDGRPMACRSHATAGNGWVEGGQKPDGNANDETRNHGEERKRWVQPPCACTRSVIAPAGHCHAGLGGGWVRFLRLSVIRSAVGIKGWQA